MKKFCYALIYILIACTQFGCGGSSDSDSLDKDRYHYTVPQYKVDPPHNKLGSSKPTPPKHKTVDESGGLQFIKKADYKEEMSVIGTTKLGDRQELEYTIKNINKETINIKIDGYSSPIKRKYGFSENCGNTLSANNTCMIKLIVHPNRAEEISQSLTVSTTDGTKKITSPIEIKTIYEPYTTITKDMIGLSHNFRFTIPMIINGINENVDTDSIFVATNKGLQRVMEVNNKLVCNLVEKDTQFTYVKGLHIVGETIYSVVSENITGEESKISYGEKIELLASNDGGKLWYTDSLNKHGSRTSTNFEIDWEVFEKITLPTGVDIEEVFTAYVDTASDTAYVGTNKGLLIISNVSLSSDKKDRSHDLYFPSELANLKVKGVYAMDGKVWVATENALFTSSDYGQNWDIESRAFGDYTMVFFPVLVQKQATTKQNEKTPEYYREILGVPEDASCEDIREAYRALISKNHPDKGGDAEESIKINEAYNKLLKNCEQ